MSPGYVSEEFAAYRVPHDERFARSEEMLDILEAAWRTDTFAHSGRYYQVPPTLVMPRPVQTRIPIWYGVSGPRLLERAARRRCPVRRRPGTRANSSPITRYDAAAAAVGFTTTERPIIREVFVTQPARSEGLAGPAIAHLFRLYERSAEGNASCATTRANSCVTRPPSISPASPRAT